jgi:hypothetical protein
MAMRTSAGITKRKGGALRLGPHWPGEPTPTPNAGTSKASRAFQVDDIEAEVADLKARSVRRLPDARPQERERHRVGRRCQSRMVQDSEGNVLAIIQSA